MKKILLATVLLSALTSSIYAADLYYGPTQENEHLYRIALKLRTNSSITVPQIMIALLSANPNAFNSSNINSLRSGYRLKIPSMSNISHISPEAAEARVHKQNQAWKLGLVESKTSKKSKAKKVDNITPQEPTNGEVSTNQVAQPQLETNQVSSVQASEPTQTPTPAPTDSIITQLPGFMADTQKYEQETNQQLAAMQKQTQELQQKVNQLTNDLSNATYHLAQLSTSLSNTKSIDYAQMLITNFKKYGLGLFASLLLLTSLLYFNKKTKAPKAQRTTSNQKDDEYDFLSGQDSIPTKLDLARAYIDMGDDTAARTTLNEVITQGNDEQKQSAVELLGKIKAYI